MCVDYQENALSDTSCSNLKERPIETELCDIHLPYCEEDNNENSNMIWVVVQNQKKKRIRFQTYHWIITKENMCILYAIYVAFKFFCVSLLRIYTILFLGNSNGLVQCAYNIYSQHRKFSIPF